MKLTGLQKIGLVYLGLSTFVSAAFSILLRTAGYSDIPFFMQFPMFQFFFFISVLFLYLGVKSMQSKKDPDNKSMGRIYKEYIAEKYPELYKKLYRMGMFSYNAHFLALLKNRYDIGEDEIINRFKIYQKTNMLLILWGFLVALIFTAINSL